MEATDGTRSDGILVTWSEVEGAHHYKVCRDLTHTGAFSSCVIQTGSSYLDTETSPGVYYWYRVAACSEHNACGLHADGCSGLSTPERGYRSCVPPAPDNLTIELVTGVKVGVKISWAEVAAPEGRAVEYHIYRATSKGGPYTKINETGDSEFTDYPPIPEEGTITYFYKVKTCVVMDDGTIDPKCGCGPLTEDAVSVTFGD